VIIAKMEEIRQQDIGLGECSFETRQGYYKGPWGNRLWKVGEGRGKKEKVSGGILEGKEV